MSIKKPYMSIDDIVEFLKSEKIKVSVFGEFSSGKTTFLNAFINEQILTVAYEPTTAVPTRIRYGKLFNILVYKNNSQIEHYFQPGEEEAIWRRIISRRSASNILGFLENQKTSIQSFMTKWTKEGEKANQVKEVVIELPLQLLINKIELIDTPGTNNEYTEHRKFTENVALETDIAIMLLDGTHGGASKTEFEFMNQVNKHVHNSLIVINKMDLIDSIDEYDDVINYLKNDSIPKHWEHAVNPKVFGLSSKLRLEEKESDDKSYLNKVFDSFMIELESMIEKNRGSILLERLGNPEKELLREARKLSKSEEVALIHTALDKYDDLRRILIAAGLSTKSVENGIQRIEEEQRKRFSSIEKNKDLFKELKDQESKINIKVYFKKLTDLKNDMNTLGFEHTESDNEIDRIQKKLKKVESDKKKIHSLLNKIDQLLVNTEVFNDSIPSARMCFSEIESIGVSKHFDDGFKNEIKGYKKTINVAMKNHIKILRKRYTLIIDDSNLLNNEERIIELYDYQSNLYRYTTIKEYDDYLKNDGSNIRIIYEKLFEQKKFLELGNSLEKIKYSHHLDEWNNDFQNLSTSLIDKKEIKQLSEKFNKKKEIIVEYEDHLNPILVKINKLFYKPLTSIEKLIEENQKIIAQPDKLLKIINNETHFSDYLRPFNNYRKKTLKGILDIDEKVRLVSRLVKVTKDMGKNNIFNPTLIHLTKKSLFLTENYFTKNNIYRQRDKLASISINNISFRTEYENYWYLYINGTYYCRKCGKNYSEKRKAISGSIRCTQKYPDDKFYSRLVESLHRNESVRKVIDRTYAKYKSKRIYRLKSNKWLSRDFSSIDMLWEMSKSLNILSSHKRLLNHKVLESFYNIPFRKGHFNSNIIEHHIYNPWLYEYLSYLEKINTQTLQNKFGSLSLSWLNSTKSILPSNNKIAYLNKQINFLKDLNKIDPSIIGGNKYSTILEHLSTLIKPYKDRRRKFYYGFLPAAAIVLTIFFSQWQIKAPLYIVPIEKKIESALENSPPHDAIRLAYLYDNHQDNYILKNVIDEKYPGLMRFLNHRFLKEHRESVVAKYFLANDFWYSEEAIDLLPHRSIEEKMKKDTLYHRLMHKYMNGYELENAVDVNLKINNYNMMLDHFIEIDDFYSILIKSKKEKRGLFKKRYEDTVASQAAKLRRSKFITKVKKIVRHEHKNYFNY